MVFLYTHTDGYKVFLPFRYLIFNPFFAILLFFNNSFQFHFMEFNCPYQPQNNSMENSQTKSNQSFSTEHEPTLSHPQPFPKDLQLRPTIHDIPIQPTHHPNFPFYQANSQVLAGSSIQVIHRAVIIPQRKRLKFWLMFELTNCRYYRETYATASKYLDLFFAKGNDVGIGSFQTLGLSCFVLASKLVESRIPVISYDSFSKQEILDFEKKICFTFNFKLLPRTYVHFAQSLLFTWDKYSNQNQTPYSIKYYSTKEQSVLSFRNMMEILDCMDLVIKTLDFDLGSLVLSLFFLIHRLNCVKKGHPKTVAQVKLPQCKVNSLYSRNDGYRKVFNKFMNYLKQQNELFGEAKVDKGILSYILPFLSLKPPSAESLPPKISCIEHFLSLQTHNEQAYNKAKNIISQSKH